MSDKKQASVIIHIYKFQNSMDYDIWLEYLKKSTDFLTKVLDNYLKVSIITCELKMLTQALEEKVLKVSRQKIELVVFKFREVQLKGKRDSLERTCGKWQKWKKASRLQIPAIDK